MAIARFVITANVTVAWPPTWAELIAGPSGGSVTAPAVPASGVAAFNPVNEPVIVTVSGGTVTVIAVNGVTTGLTTGSVDVPAGGSITLTYSVAPTWTWAAMALPTGVSGETILVSSAAPPGGQAGTIPLVTFLEGTTIDIDTATPGGASLQSAIGGGNLRAYVQGQDDVGHAGLAN